MIYQSPSLSEPLNAVRARRYFACWALVIPISSILVIPGIQGTTPAYLMALLAAVPMTAVWLLSPQTASTFYRHLAILVCVYVVWQLLAQLTLSVTDPRSFGAITLIDPGDGRLLLRSSLFSQSLYLLCVAITFCFVRTAYCPSWDRYLFLGGAVTAIYGLYEVAYFLATGQSGDFISNRTFGDGLHPGSWFQTMTVAGATVQRLKSLTGEPSMYALTALPFWIYALHMRRHWMALIFFATLVLTFATSALLGFATYLAFRLATYGFKDKFVIVGTAVVLVLLGLGLSGYAPVLDVYDQLVHSKLAGESASGAGRTQNAIDGIQSFLALPAANILVGAGFGYARSADLLSTLLFNVGLAGTGLFCLLALAPLFRLGASERERGLKAAIAVTAVVMLVAVPEYAYLSTWVFWGMAYNAMDKVNAASEQRSHKRRISGAQVVNSCGASHQ